jgi:hypothetical protein
MNRHGEVMHAHDGRASPLPQKRDAHPRQGTHHCPRPSLFV